jgi:hypothetical protein
MLNYQRVYHIISTHIEFSYRSLGVPVNDLLPFKGLPQNPLDILGSANLKTCVQDKEEFVAWITAIGLPQHGGDTSQPRDARFFDSLFFND